MTVQLEAIQVIIKHSKEFMLIFFSFFPGLRSFVRNYIRESDTCQRKKGENVSPAGLLLPLLILRRNWTEISMDFIEGLPGSQGNEVIMVVVDRLSKYAHFIPLSHPSTAVTMAQLFLDSNFKLHDLPLSIVIDQDLIFTNNF